MVVASGVRIGWSQLPLSVRSGVEEIIGAPVVAAISQSGGFSPGTADRVRTADGRRAFVKAVSPEQNEHSAEMHRREARVTAGLPASIPVPRLLGCYDDGTWVALVLEDVDGRHPRTPWVGPELAAVFLALDKLADALTPSPVDGVPTARELLGHDLSGWHRVAEEPPEGLDPWAAAHLAELCAWTDRGLAALDGPTLVHSDLRADNLLVDRDGRVMVVDWPWACLGPAWLDPALLLINVRLYGGHDAHALLLERAARAQTDPEELLAVIAAVGGYFVDAARRPAPVGLPTVRAFQRAQGEAVLDWLRETFA
jgi:aminoglycoside phosphotransferase (APT) family kinase protein